MTNFFKFLIRCIALQVIVKGPIWSLLGRRMRKHSYFRVQRRVVEEKSFQSKVAISFPHLRIRNGPFKGTFYPQATSGGSALWPKLIGVYERELHEAFELILGRPYQTIIDWGCAEGYYLVGLGMRQSTTQLFGIDPDDHAR